MTRCRLYPEGTAGVEVHEIEPRIDRDEILAGAQFIDAYCVTIGDAVLDARSVAERLFERPPRWVDGLMTVRNCLVTPFGLTRDASKVADGSAMIGFFPVVSESRNRIVLGFDDKHLDFRVVIDLFEADGDRRVAGTTLVRTHNLLGRAYLAATLPFHRVIVRSMLRQVSKSLRE